MNATRLAVVETLAARAVGVVGVELRIAHVVTDARIVPLTVDQGRNAAKGQKKERERVRKKERKTMWADNHAVIRICISDTPHCQLTLTTLPQLLAGARLKLPRVLPKMTKHLNTDSFCGHENCQQCNGPRRVGVRQPHGPCSCRAFPQVATCHAQHRRSALPRHCEYCSVAGTALVTSHSDARPQTEKTQGRNLQCLSRTSRRTRCPIHTSG